MSETRKVVVIGGCGHVGLPLAIVAATSGWDAVICDVNDAAIAQVLGGQMPFIEEGAEPLLRDALASGRLTATNRADAVSEASIVVLVIGTPIDEHLTPRPTVILRALEHYLPHFRNGQVLILRSTVYPGVSAKVQRFFEQHGLDVAVAFCPERIAQGHAIREIAMLPQIVSAFSQRGVAAAEEFFRSFAKSTLVIEPLEAELAKLFSNTYRYVQFATANQFYTIATSAGANYSRIYQAMRHDYPRLTGLPGPGFAAGPCLFKDTMQLSAFSKDQFSLGLAAVWINEGLPRFLIDQLAKQCDISKATVGILGMAFKADSDDIRDSLSYKLKKLVQLEAARTLCHDPFVRDETFTAPSDLIRESDAIVLATPHSEYKNLRIPRKIVIDVWNFWQNRAPAHDPERS